MAGISTLQDHLKNVKYQAMEMTSMVLSLGTIFTEEANRLSREKEIQSLKSLYAAISNQVEEVKRHEDSASSDHIQAKLNSLGELAGRGIIKMVFNNKQPSALSDNLLKGPNEKQRPYGMVLIYVGQKGIPEDVGVVSVSQIARGSYRQELDVINNLQARGCLLFNKEEFSLLIDKLVIAVQERRLHLPISRENCPK
jgi:hypothetical protein